MKCINCFKEFDEKLNMCPHCGYVASEYEPDAYQLVPGTILDNRYIIGVVAGVGGFGIVYKAWDTKLERVVAIKEFYPTGMVNRIPGTEELFIVSSRYKKDFEYCKKRFLCEARNAVKFSSHKNIINVYEFFEANNSAYIVMDLLQGIPLNKYLKENGKISVENTVQIINCVCEALKVLHKEKVVHRDISPDNIYLCDDGNVVLFDFGTAEFSDDNIEVLDVVIKAGYSPVEQYNKVNEQGPWTDIYALGATMYVMLTAVRPPESSTRKINDELIPPQKVDESISLNINNAIVKAMAIDKHMRFENVADFQKAINGEIKVADIDVERKKRKRKRFIAIGAALVSVIIGISVVATKLIIQKESTTLKPAELTIWIKGEKESGDYSAIKGITDKFCEAYPDIEIEIVAVDIEEYDNKVLEAAGNNNLPNLFVSTGIEESELDNVLDVEDVVKSKSAKECYFLDDYENVYNNFYKIPMGVNIPIAYYITSGAGGVECDIDTVKDVSEIGSDFAINEKYSFILNESFGENINSDNEYEEFLEGKIPVLVSSSKDFIKVRKDLSDRIVKVVGLDTKNVVCEFDDEWSIGKGSKEQNKAAKRLLEYMLSSAAQDIKYLETTDKSGAIPVNKETYKSYTNDIFESDLSELYDLVGKYEVRSED